MPGTPAADIPAPHTSTSPAAAAPPGRVIDAAHRFGDNVVEPADPAVAEEQLREQVAEWWRQQFASRGRDLADPGVAEDVRVALGVVNMLIRGAVNEHGADPGKGLPPRYAELVREILRDGAQSATRLEKRRAAGL